MKPYCFLVTRHSSLVTIFSLLLFLFLAACTPYATPAFLANTPASSFTVDEGANRYSNDQFSVIYPEGWRVISNPADAPFRVIFAADDCHVIVITATEAQRFTPNCDVPVQDSQEQITVDEMTLMVQTIAPEAEAVALAPTFQAVIASLRSITTP